MQREGCCRALSSIRLNLDWYFDMFDPYRKWLGILPKDQPPNYYRLLSLELFEDDLDVIEAAVDRTMGFIRQYQSGEYATEAAALLNEIARARLCLLKPESKAEYDSKLKSEIGGVQAPTNTTAADELDWETVKLTSRPRRTVAPKRKKSKKRSIASTQWVMGGAAVLLVLVAGSVLSMWIQNMPPASNATNLAVAERKNHTQTIAATNTPSVPSTPPEKTREEIADQAKSDEQAKSDVTEQTKPDPAPADTTVPSASSPSAETVSRFDPAAMTNLFPRGDMEFAGSDFKRAFIMVTPDGKPFTLSRWAKDPHSGNACLHISGHILGKEQWACVKLFTLDIPPGKTIHGSMWRRADHGTGNFLLGGSNNKVKVMDKEIYGPTSKEWEETTWKLTPEELKNATQLDIELVTSKEFDVYFDDICVWTE